MTPDSPHWKQITPSDYPWEREALAFVKERLPDHEPYRAWANFEFIADDASINEVDLLLLTKKGFYLVEIKSRPGRVEGDAGTWVWYADGRPACFDDNPLLLANRKAKKLMSLLRRQKSAKSVELPFLAAVVFLSHESNTNHLPANLTPVVFLRDQPATRTAEEKHGIITGLTRWTDATAPRRPIDKPIAKALTRAMEEAGIRPSKRMRRIGDYELESLLFECADYQDWKAHHVALEKDFCRVRVYAVDRSGGENERTRVTQLAKREYQILSGISHDGILKARLYTESERGPALFFEYSPDWQRLDHYLAERGQRLDAGQALGILRKIAEAVQYAHEKRLVHRALSPQSILVVDPSAAEPQLRIFNWQTGARATLATRMSSLGMTGTSHVGAMVDSASAVYMAPEAMADRVGADEQLDVFSLGALAYHVFTGKPPAATYLELHDKLRKDGGLRVSAVLDGAPESLDMLVQFATHPDVTARLDSADDFLKELEKVEEELTTPDQPDDLVLDPTTAKPGDQLAHGLLVKRRLGKGSSAVALLVERDGKEFVLKIASTPDDSERLREEGEVLAKLRHQSIVALEATLVFGERVGLLLQKAGDETLAQRLREEGRLHLDLLERFGEDLLQVIDWLEQKGVAHRDIKPENLGVASLGRGDRLHLVLFDFSLAKTPADNIRAGTVPYLDPFLTLRKPPRWDTHAERFAAAMTLHEMATGQLPRWGDGTSDPALLNVEAAIDTESFEPSLRDTMTAFLAKALRRNYKERFDNAQEMLSAWREIFVRAGEPANRAATADETTQPAPATDISPTTPLVLLGLSTRAMNALDRVGAATVQDLLRTPIAALSHMRGVGNKTRKELAQRFRDLADRFPEIVANATPQTAPEEEAEGIADAATLSVDALAAVLVPAKRASRSDPGAEIERCFLRLNPNEADAPEWPGQSDVARDVGVTRARIGQVLTKARARWRKTAAVTALREEIVSVLEQQAGVMTADELAQAIRTRRGSAQPDILARRHAAAAVRAAIETERDAASPRWIVRRSYGSGRMLIARDDIDAQGRARIDGQKLADWAERLGEHADELATADPLLSPDRIVEALQAIKPPAGHQTPDPNRLRQLAVATSASAALSSRLEIYPRGLDAARAVRLAVGALAGAAELTPEKIQQRVSGRYPAAAPLPPRPELDLLIAEAGSQLQWNSSAGAGRGAYTVRYRDFTTIISGTSYASTPRITLARQNFTPLSDEAIEAAEFESRLRYSLDQEHFLAIMVQPQCMLLAEAALEFRFPVTLQSIDALLISAMHESAKQSGADWNVVLRADGTPPTQRSSSTDWANLSRLVVAALQKVERQIAESRQAVLLSRPGLLARYDQLGWVNTLRERAGRDGVPAIWMLLASDDQKDRPVVDGKPVPLFSTAHWTRLPEAWLSARGARPVEVTGTGATA